LGNSKDGVRKPTGNACCEMLESVKEETEYHFNVCTATNTAYAELHWCTIADQDVLLAMVHASVLYAIKFL
jgi:hypothetical protein